MLFQLLVAKIVGREVTISAQMSDIKTQEATTKFNLILVIEEGSRDKSLKSMVKITQEIQQAAKTQCPDVTFQKYKIIFTNIPYRKRVISKRKLIAKVSNLCEDRLEMILINFKKIRKVQKQNNYYGSTQKPILDLFNFVRSKALQYADSIDFKLKQITQLEVEGLQPQQVSYLKYTFNLELSKVRDYDSTEEEFDFDIEIRRIAEFGKMTVTFEIEEDNAQSSQSSSEPQVSQNEM